MMTRTSAFVPADAPVQTPADAPFESSRSRRWTSLLDRIAEGDLEACGAFYDESSQLAFSLIVQAVGDRDLAEDILVDLYVDIRDRAQRGEHRRCNALAWVLELAQNATGRIPDRSHFPVLPSQFVFTFGSGFMLPCSVFVHRSVRSSRFAVRAKPSEPDLRASNGT